MRYLLAQRAQMVFHAGSDATALDSLLDRFAARPFIEQGFIILAFQVWKRSGLLFRERFSEIPGTHHVHIVDVIFGGGVSFAVGHACSCDPFAKTGLEQFIKIKLHKDTDSKANRVAMI